MSRRPVQPIDVVLFFDVEDIFSPPELGNDDSIKELAEILTDEGIPGVFLIVGDRAELLRARKRHDVIAAMAKHEVGLHTRSARHPCPPEYVADVPWAEGVAEMVRREGEGCALLAEIFGRPACALSAHNVFTCPQAHAAAARLKLPMVYGYPAAPPLYSVSWYCGALCLPAWNTDVGEACPAYGLEWDDVYPDASAFERQFRRHDEFVDGCRRAGQPYVTQLMYHPQRLRLAEFIDHYWSPNGINLPESEFGALGSPRRYSAAQSETARRNFRRLVRRLKEDPRVRICTLREVTTKYGQCPAEISRDQLLAACRTAANARRVPDGQEFSAAEILLGMAAALAEYARDGGIPTVVPAVEVMGPIENPVIQPEARSLSFDALVAAANECVRRSLSGYLPANFGAPFARFGVNHLFVALAEALTAIEGGNPRPEVKLARTPRCPPEAEAVGRRFLAIAEGELVNPDLKGDGLYRHGKLQTWTLKPAAPCLP